MNPNDMPSRRYIFRAIHPETEEVMQEKLFDPSLQDSRKGSIGAHIWAWSEGYITETELAE